MTLNLYDKELDVLADIRRAGGFLSDEDAIKGALWHFARYLGIEIHPAIFGLAISAALRHRAEAEDAPDPDQGDQGDLFAEGA